MKTRIISAIFMIAIMTTFLILGGLPLKYLTILFGVFGLYEIISIKEKEQKLPIIIKIFSYIFMIIFIYVEGLSYNILSILCIIYLIPIVFINNNKKYNIKDAFFMIASTFFIGLAFKSFLIVCNIDIKYIIFLFLITIMTDTFAYFGGSLIGKHKLCKNISPKKTVEGAVIGSVIGTIVPVMFYIYIIGNTINIFILIIITLILSIAGQLGDLVFSSIKRNYKVKDFSKLIPGHGGLLDRFDSIIFVILTYLMLVSFL